MAAAARTEGRFCFLTHGGKHRQRCHCTVLDGDGGECAVGGGAFHRGRKNGKMSDGEIENGGGERRWWCRDGTNRDQNPVKGTEDADRGQTKQTTNNLF